MRVDASAQRWTQEGAADANDPVFLSILPVKITATERIRARTGVGRRGFEPLTSCVSTSATGSSTFHHGPRNHPW